MDLFTITCTTCKSRLKVRDPSAVGHILACPKCGGMVMVKPPAAWSGEAEKSDAGTATEIVAPMLRFDQTVSGSAFEAVEELLSDAPPKVQSPPSATPSPAPPSSTPSKPRFIDGPPLARAAAMITPPPIVVPKTPGNGAAASSATPPGAAAASSGTQPSKEAVTTDAATANKLSAALTGNRHWLLMAASVLVGMLLAVAAVTAAIYFSPEPSQKNSPWDSAAAKTGSELDQVSAAQPPAESLPAGNDDPAPSTSASAKTATEVPAVEASTQVASTPAAPTPAPAEADPLGLLKPPENAPPTSSPPTGAFTKLDWLIAGASESPAKATTPPREPAPPPDPAPIRPLAPRPPPREVDVARRLADPLLEIETPGTPLADFLQLISDLSTIPITLETEALPFAPATAQSLVKLQLANTTVGKALAEALKSMRLEFVVVNDQLVVRRVESNPPTPLAHPVNDLTGDDEQAMVELAEMLQAVVEPGAWGEEAGGGSVAITASKGEIVVISRRAIQAQMLIAIEKLRTAHAPPLPHKLNIDLTLFQLETRWSRAKPRLETPVTLNYSQPMRLATVLQRLGELTGVRILVDWRDIASAGWNPAAEATLSVQKQSLSVALDQLLSPLDLAWRVIDGQTLQVITPTRAADQGESEVYQVGDLLGADASGEALLAKIKTSLGPALFRDGGGKGEIRFDAGSKCVLAWLTQPKQRELESLLTQWRREKV